MRSISGSKKTSLSLLLSTALAASGCVSSGAAPATSLDDAGLVVVERSKAQPPAWVQLAPGTVRVTPQELRVVTARSKLLNLPLGLRQTQLVGLDTGRSALALWLKTTLEAGPGATPVDLPAAKQELERLARATVEGPAGAKLRVSDLYYEGLDNREAAAADLMRHYYAVYLLTVFPKAQIPQLYRDLGERLRRSPEPSLRRLAAVAASLEQQVP